MAKPAPEPAVAKPALEPAPGPPQATPAQEAAAFYDDVRKHLASRDERGAQVLLSIPVWGWVGDGKTCSLLTAIQYCEPLEHAIGFALVSDLTELRTFEEDIEEYRGLNLSSVAAATTQRLRELSEVFFDKAKWLPGTDEPAQYIVALRTVDRQLGYASLPDLKGGSFRENDAVARTVLFTGAHACIVLVSPERYGEPGTEGKRYRDEILSLLQRFARDSIPVCVMITKADLAPGPHQDVDSTHNELTILTAQQTKLKSKVFRVTVVGMPTEDASADPPLVGDRNPEQLLQAWVWTVDQALSRATDEIRLRVPAMHLQTSALSLVPKPQTLAEVRRVGDYSAASGTLLCDSADDDHSRAFCFVATDGTISEALWDKTGELSTQSRGKADAWEPSSELDASYADGELLFGPRRNANALWTGAKTALIERVGLPSQLISWCRVGSRRIVGLDPAGRLHSLRLEQRKWVQTSYLEGFISPTPIMACGALSSSPMMVVAVNGTAVHGVLLDADGTFGARVSPPFVLRFDTPQVAVSATGLAAAATAAGSLVLSGASGVQDVGAVSRFALTPNKPLVAAVGPDLRLSVMKSTGTAAVRSDPDFSPVLPASPNGMVWDRSGRSITVTFPDGTWSVFRPVGMESHQ